MLKNARPRLESTELGITPCTHTDFVGSAHLTYWAGRQSDAPATKVTHQQPVTRPLTSAAKVTLQFVESSDGRPARPLLKNTRRFPFADDQHARIQLLQKMRNHHESLYRNRLSRQPLSSRRSSRQAARSDAGASAAVDSPGRRQTFTGRSTIPCNSLSTEAAW